MKDALGHGSDNRGGSPVPPIGRGVHGRYLIQKLNTGLVGNPWQVAGRIDASKNSRQPAAKAERIAERMRIDNPDTLFRVK
jgi:hypothetical protein